MVAQNNQHLETNGAGTSTDADAGLDADADAVQPSNFKTLISASEYNYTFVRPGKLGLPIGVNNHDQNETDPGGTKVNKPCAHVGIEPGDELIAIAGTNVKNWSFNDVVSYVFKHTERPLTIKFQAAPLFPRPRYVPANSAGPVVAANKSDKSKCNSRYKQRPVPSRRPSVVQNVWVLNQANQSSHHKGHTDGSLSVASESLLSTATVSELKSFDNSTSNKNGRGRQKRAFYDEDGNASDMEHPTVTNLQFDRRFLEYLCTPYGGIHYEKLVGKKKLSSTTPMSTPRNKRRRLIEMVLDNDLYLEAVPDEPPKKVKYLQSGYCIKASRVGPPYQAAVASWPKQQQDDNHDCDDNSSDGHSEGRNFSCIWDPKLADEAERRGEDISNFLRGNLELKARENRMALLHEHGYDVAAATAALKLSQSEPTSMLTCDEAMTFDAVVLNKKTRKHFAVLSETLQRSRVDCQIHYYKWKATNRNDKYKTLKSELKEYGRFSDYCVVCEDGGDMIVCDGCSGLYHLYCIDPPLDKIPEDDWFCQKCSDRMEGRGNFNPLSPVSSRRWPIHLTLSPSSQRRGIA